MPLCRCLVANVALNLCSQKLLSSNSVLFTTAFRQSRKLSLGLHPVVGKTRLHVLFAFAFSVLRLCRRLSGMGISRSLYCFGVQPRSGLWVTRTVAWAMLMSVQYVYIASCSRIPVIRKNSYQSFSWESQAANRVSRSSCS